MACQCPVLSRERSRPSPLHAPASLKHSTFKSLPHSAPCLSNKTHTLTYMLRTPLTRMNLILSPIPSVNYTSLHPHRISSHIHSAFIDDDKVEDCPDYLQPSISSPPTSVVDRTAHFQYETTRDPDFHVKSNVSLLHNAQLHSFSSSPASSDNLESYPLQLWEITVKVPLYAHRIISHNLLRARSTGLRHHVFGFFANLSFRGSLSSHLHSLITEFTLWFLINSHLRTQLNPICFSNGQRNLGY